MIINLKGIANTRTVWVNDRLLRPERSQSVYNHSPDGFMWGYGGSGPSQLALAVLLEFTSEQVALRNYQDFKFKVIAGLKIDNDFNIDIDISEYIK